MKRIMFIAFIIGMIAIVSPVSGDVIDVYAITDGNVYSSGIPFLPFCTIEDICLGLCGSKTADSGSGIASAGRRIVTETYYNYETHWVFQLPAIDGTVTYTLLRIYVQYKGPDNGGLIQARYSVENPLPISTGDYRNASVLADSKTWSQVTAGVYNNWGIHPDSTQARLGGVFPLKIQTSLCWDCWPNPAPAEYLRFRTEEHTGGTPPMLRITYTPTPTPAGAYRAAVKTGAEAARLGKSDLIKTNERSDEP